MEIISFSINSNPMSLNDFHCKYYLSCSKIELDKKINSKNIKNIKITDGIRLRSETSIYTFNKIYFTMLINHLLNIASENQRLLKISEPYIYKPFKLLNLDEPVVKLLEIIEKKYLIPDFINLTKKYGFKCDSYSPNKINLNQIIEIINIENLNNGIYYFG